MVEGRPSVYVVAPHVELNGSSEEDGAIDFPHGLASLDKLILPRRSLPSLRDSSRNVYCLQLASPHRASHN